MPRKTAGHRFPHATTEARPHDHTMCKIIDMIAERAGSGDEEWGTVHRMPPLPDAAQAHAVRNKLFNARKCRTLARIHGTLSVSVRYATDTGELTNTRTVTAKGYVLAVAVYPRAQARQNIITRVNSGERLSYNAYRETS